MGEVVGSAAIPVSRVSRLLPLANAAAASFLSIHCLFAHYVPAPWAHLAWEIPIAPRPTCKMSADGKAYLEQHKVEEKVSAYT